MSFLPPLKPLPSEIQFPISSSSAISRTKKSAAAGHRRNCCGDARKISEGAWESALPPISLCRTTQTEPRTGRRGFAFNILSLSSDPGRRRPNLYYADPAEMLAYCLSRYGRSVAILQDYGLYEFTVLVRHTQG